MAGYSGTPLAKKLGIKAGGRVWLVNAPEEMATWLAPLPADVRLLQSGGKGLDVVVYFTKEVKALSKRFPALAKALQPAGGLWIAWPKKSAGVATDLDEGVVRRIGLDAGLVDNKVCAVSDVWSGLRFVYRLKDR